MTKSWLCPRAGLGVSYKRSHFYLNIWCHLIYVERLCVLDVVVRRHFGVFTCELIFLLTSEMKTLSRTPITRTLQWVYFDAGGLSIQMEECQSAYAPQTNVSYPDFCEVTVLLKYLHIISQNSELWYKNTQNSRCKHKWKPLEVTRVLLWLYKSNQVV